MRRVRHRPRTVLTLEPINDGRMLAIDHVRQEFAQMRHHVTAIVGGLGRETLLWTPPGTANPIALTLVHLALGEDRVIQECAGQRPTLWETGRWQERIGLGALPARGHDWRGIALETVREGAIFDYGQAVGEATTRYLAELDNRDLARLVDFYGQPQPLAQVLTSVVIHSVSHAGEVAALKGIHGLRGRPS